MTNETILPETGFELLPDTPCCYIEIHNSGKIDLNRPYEYTFDSIEYGNSNVTETTGAFAVKDGDSQIPGRFLGGNSFLMVIPQELITDDNVTIRASDNSKLLFNLSPEMVVGLISTDNSKGSANRLAIDNFPNAKVFTMEEWAKFKNPNEIIGGLMEANQ